MVSQQSILTGTMSVFTHKLSRALKALALRQAPLCLLRVAALGLACAVMVACGSGSSNSASTTADSSASSSGQAEAAAELAGGAVTASSVPALTRIDLVVASDLSIIQTLANGAEIDVSTLSGAVNFTITSSDISATGSIGITMSGCGTLDRHENYAPYTAAVESQGLASLNLGSCVITATPYSGANLQGQVGSPLTRRFTVVDHSIQLPPTLPATPPVATAPTISACNDGIDNDGDGFVDWQQDLGCWGAGDASETSGSREQENGWTTFDVGADSRVIYVSASEGSDANDGLTPATAVATPARGAELVRDGSPDFLLFKRGDVWRDVALSRFKSGKSADQPLVIASYGDSTVRPRFEVVGHFLNDNGHARRYLAVIGLEVTSYRKDPANAAFDGATGGGIRYVSSDASSDLLFEDNVLNYGEFIIQNAQDVELRRNIVYRHYHVGTCAFNDDGSANLSGNPAYRPSGIFAGDNNGLLLEGNTFDSNGWHPDVAEACATIYNHNMYLSNNKNTVVKDNISLRPSSIGLKLKADEGLHTSDNLLIENNLFIEGEIGISIGGNTSTEYRFGHSIIRANVFTNIGRNTPTTRELSWYIEVLDNDDTLIENNLFLNSPAFSNTFGIHLYGGSNRNIHIANNYFYDLYRKNVLVNRESTWSDISIDSNTFVSTSSASCFMDHRGDFNGFSYSSNTYQSASADNAWFCLSGLSMSLSQWQVDAGEADATVAGTLPDGLGRNVEAYLTDQGLGTSLDDFSRELRKQSRFSYSSALTATAVNDFIRAGHGMAD